MKNLSLCNNNDNDIIPFKIASTIPSYLLLRFKTFLPFWHITLRLMKEFFEALNQDSSGFAYLNKSLMYLVMKPNTMEVEA